MKLKYIRSNWVNIKQEKEEIKINEFDKHAISYIHFTYCFENLILDLNYFNLTLKKTLDYLPRLGGKFIKNGENIKAYYNGKGIKVLEFISQLDFSQIKFQNFPINKLNSIYMNKNLKKLQNKNVPLIIQIFNFKNNNIAINFNFNHMLGDFVLVSNFLSLFCSFYNQKSEIINKPLELNKKLELKTSKYIQPLIPNPIDGLINYYSLDFGLKKLIYSSYTFLFSSIKILNEPINYKQVIFHFSKSNLQSLKNDISSSSPNSWISTNDCLTALLAKTKAESYNLNEEDIFSIENNVDFRLIKGFEFPKSSLGNNILPIQFEVQVKQLKNLFHIAQLNRQAINNFNYEKIIKDLYVYKVLKPQSTIKNMFYVENKNKLTVSSVAKHTIVSEFNLNSNYPFSSNIDNDWPGLMIFTSGNGLNVSISLEYSIVNNFINNKDLKKYISSFSY